MGRGPTARPNNSKPRAFRAPVVLGALAAVRAVPGADGGGGTRRGEGVQGADSGGAAV
jgi:hypothetical protein